jgi:hypothetical protein
MSASNKNNVNFNKINKQLINKKIKICAPNYNFQLIKIKFLILKIILIMNYSLLL